ncbi:hypothetical protein BDV95DRAFT_654192 [Massariosphaeria phaeospora]|uniref:Uncharacterized protein n=1 Tax=Massariosphaeria phaeospora TaxID=100035 RepID=A0A7C8IL44_9PLEO|nr:hypothetical protein BDV95DRAFT_654192 [Massariosphaeria phaeospora]
MRSFLRGLTGTAPDPLVISDVPNASIASPPPPEQPHWAVDTAPRPFVMFTSLHQPNKSLLLNTPYIGPYAPVDRVTTRAPPTIALAVFARFDVRNRRLWLAVRQIRTAPTPQGRQEEMRWVPYEDASTCDELRSAPGKQIFQPRMEFCQGGELDEGKVVAAWLEKIRLGWRRSGLVGEDPAWSRGVSIRDCRPWTARLLS